MTYQTKESFRSRIKSSPSRYRYLLLFISVFGSSLLLLSINNYMEITSFGNSLTGTWYSNSNPEVVGSDDSFTIKTKGCTIPRLQPFDETIRKFVRRPTSLRPCNNQNNSLLQNNDTHIWLLKDKLKYYDVPEDKEINCCYKSFFRPDVTNMTAGDLDDRVQYEPCINFTNIIKVVDEFVRVTCGYDNRSLYEQFFLFTFRKPFSLYREDVTEAPINNNRTAYNVLVVGIDAISRLNFHRTMPRTLSFLKKKGAVELLGYNKVGDNTFPNLTPMLMGIKDKDLQQVCWSNNKDTFDNCPFVWNWFKNAGFYTAFGEDSASLGTFGFNGSPTDYYIHTFMHEAEVHAGNNRDFNSYVCMGNKYFYKVLLDYIESLTSTLKHSKLFGFFWEVTLSHDYLNYPMLMDKSYKNFLQRLDSRKYLDNTVLILLSDHGIRWGDIRYTKQGRLEERLPFVYILLPPSFKNTYSSAFKNLKQNSKRLTTPFDIYATLLDLINLDNLKDDELKKRYDISEDPRSFSLFVKIPENRTCQTVGIDDHWCTCHTGKRLSKDSKEAREAAGHLVSHLNSLLRGHIQCAKLKMREILEVTEMIAGVPGENEVGWREFMVVVRTEPGGGVFEATLRHDSRGWDLAGTASRLNLYGTQSRCVHHYQLKLYCYCR